MAEAQALRSRKSFARRLGEDDKAAFQVAMSAAELQGACDAWIDTVYGREPHQGLAGRSPFEAAAGQPVRTISDDPLAGERALDVLLAEPADGGGWRTVQKKGLKVDGAWFVAPELGALVGEGVSVKRDPADFGGVYVFDRVGGFVCRAVAPEREGIDRAAVAAAMREAARHADSEARAYARALKRKVKPEEAIQAMLNAGREEAARVVAFPAATTAHASPGLAAATAAASSESEEHEPDAPVLGDGAAEHLDAELAFLRRRQRQLDEEEARRRAAEAAEEEDLRAFARRWAAENPMPNENH